MTTRQLEKLFAQWQARLGLHEWRLSFFHDWDFDMPEDKEPPSFRVQSHTHYRWANIYVLKSFRLDYTLEEATPEIIHELLHLALQPILAAAELIAPSNETAAGIYESALLTAEEVTVDRLAHALARWS